MPISDYVRRIRERVGHAPILLPSVALLIFDSQEQLLLVRPAEFDYWVAPGGAIDPGERPEDAAMREAWEETGLRVEVTGLWGVYGGPDCRVTYPNGDVVDYVMVIYFARPEAGAPAPRDTEISEARYFSREDVAGLTLAPWARVVLPQVFAGRQK